MPISQPRSGARLEPQGPAQAEEVVDLVGVLAEDTVCRGRLLPQR